jgi:RNA polymerase sigma factor (sigma-70 family)
VDLAGETRELLRRWHDQADYSAREELVTRMLPLARSLARRYANKGEPLDDLEQVASVGLLKAIDRFDLDREVKFATFAVPTIAGEIKRHFRDRGWMLRVPREVQELNARLSRTREALTRDLGRAPTVDELAPREREILRLRFFEGLTQREIADEVGISQMHVSRLIRRSVDALRDTISPPMATAA